MIIPPCRVHPYELTGAKLSFIGEGGRTHRVEFYPPEDSAPVAHTHPTCPEEEDDWNPRVPYLSRLSYLSRRQAELLASQENIPGSTSANRSKSRIGFLIGSPYFRLVFNQVRLVPYCFEHSGSIYSVRFAKFNSQKVI